MICNLKLRRLLKTLFNLRKMLSTDQECMDHLECTQEALMPEACTDHQEPHLTNQHQGHPHQNLRGFHHPQLQLGHLHLLDPSLLQDQLTNLTFHPLCMAQVIFLRAHQNHLIDHPQLHQSHQLHKSPLLQRLQQPRETTLKRLPHQESPPLPIQRRKLLLSQRMRAQHGKSTRTRLV